MIDSLLEKQIWRVIRTTRQNIVEREWTEWEYWNNGEIQTIIKRETEEIGGRVIREYNQKIGKPIIGFESDWFEIRIEKVIDIIWNRLIEIIR